MPTISTQTADSRPDRNSQLDIDIHSTQSNNWASLVSTPLIHDNRFNVLATTDDDHSDGELFMEQRLARVKRRRQQSAQQRQQKPTDQGRLHFNRIRPNIVEPWPWSASRPHRAPVSQQPSRYARRWCFVWTMWVRHIPLMTFVHMSRACRFL